MKKLLIISIITSAIFITGCSSSMYPRNARYQNRMMNNGFYQPGFYNQGFYGNGMYPYGGFQNRTFLGRPPVIIQQVPRSNIRRVKPRNIRKVNPRIQRNFNKGTNIRSNTVRPVIIPKK